MIKLFWACVFTVIISNTVIAQDCLYSIKGRVTDFHNSTPISGATLHILEVNKYTTTNHKGEFEFKNLCSAKLTIIVQHIACDSKTININLTSNTYKEILLEHH